MKTFILEPNTERKTRKIVFIILLTLIVLLSGCAKPETITKTIYKDVYIPVRCEIEMPVKPKFNRLDPASAKELAMYYQQIEALLKGCVKVYGNEH